MFRSQRQWIIGGMIVMMACVLGTSQIWAAPAQPAAPSGPPTSVTDLSLGVSWASLDVNGYRNRYEQYVTPPHGWYVSELGLRHWQANGATLFDMRLRDLGEPSVNSDVWASLGKGAVVLRALQRHSSYYPDWDSPGNPAEGRRDGRFDLTAPVGRGEVRVSYREVVKSPPTGSPLEDKWRDNFTAARYSSHFGNWQAAASYQNERFDTANLTTFNGSAGTTALSVIPPTGNRTFLEGSASVTHTSLDGLAQAPNYQRASLQGGTILTKDLTLYGSASHYAISDYIAETAFAKSASDGHLTAEYQGLWHTTLDVGLGDHAVDFLDDNRAESTDTSVHDFQAKIVTRFNRALKVQASQHQWWATSRPTAFDLGGTPEGALDWSFKTDQKAEVSYTPNWHAGATATWHELKWDNSSFGMRNSLVDNGFFGWWLPQENLTLYGTIVWQDFGLVGPTSLGGIYTTNNRTWVVGGSYQFSRATMADLSFSRSQSSGALGVDQRIVSASLSHSWRSGDRLTATVVQDSFTTSESTPTLDFNGSRYELRFTKAVAWVKH